MARLNLRSFLSNDLLRLRYIKAVLKMKEDGVYQIFVDWHGNADVGNVAHTNVSFLAWHRIFVRLFEIELQNADDAVWPEDGDSEIGIAPASIRSVLELPYWDYTDYNSTDPILDTGRIWRPDFLGSASSTHPFRVINGAFRASTQSDPYDKWEIKERVPNTDMADLNSSTFTYHPNSRTGPFLVRTLGVFNANLPLATELSATIRKPKFDDNYFGYFPGDPENSSGDSHRQVCEGWFPTGVHTDPRRDSRLHNGVHVFIGGHMGDVPAAPNDPAFFLHHCNIDRIWAKWQIRNNTSQAQYPTDAEIINVRTNPGASGKTNAFAKTRTEPLIPWESNNKQWKKRDGTLLFTTMAYTAKHVLNWGNMGAGLGSYQYDDVNSRSIRF